MQFVNGVIYGSGFTAGAVLVLVVIRAIFHVGICG